MRINKTVRILALSGLALGLAGAGFSTLAQDREDDRDQRATSIVVSPGSPIVNPSPGPPIVAPHQPIPLFDVDLTAAASQSSYYTGEPIVIDLTLTNQSNTAVALNDMILGNIRVTAMTRDGARVATVATESSFGDGFGPELESSLKSVPKNATLDFEWRSSYHDDLAGEALLTSRYTAGESIGASTFRSVAQPGAYSITFHYKYPGPNGTFGGSVFKGKTNSVTVTFTVM